MAHIGRRELITALGGAVPNWPLVARAQQASMPVIGYLGVTFAGEQPDRLAAFRQGLGEAGFIEGKNLLIEYGWAEGHYDRYPELVADLIHRQVGIIATPGNTKAALAAKAATTTVPIVFAVGDDPVTLGLVMSINRPGGNATGIHFLTAEVVAKRLGLLRELLPGATRVAVLVNPGDADRAGSTAHELDSAARAMGLNIKVFNAATSQEIDDVFATLGRERPDALYVGPDSFFNRRRTQLAILAARHVIPATYAVRDYADAGGLMSYGTNINDAYRQAGVYTGRILKGVKPADLPVMRSTTFELVINLQTAKALGIDVPASLIARADAVIE